jgi:ribonuclease PH
MRKMQKGRRKNKRFHNEMDDMEKGYDNDMYGSGDFDQMKNKVHCSVCHGKRHTMNRHKQGSKRNPRVRGAEGRNRRSGATTIIEVTHTNNIEKVFYLLVCTNIICCICN